MRAITKNIFKLSNTNSIRIRFQGDGLRNKQPHGSSMILLLKYNYIFFPYMKLSLLFNFFNLEKGH